MDFWTGPATLKYEGSQDPREVRVFLDLDFDLKVEMTDLTGFDALKFGMLDDLSVEIPGVSGPIPLLISHTSTSVDGPSKIILSPKRSPIWRTTSNQLTHGRAALLNFTGFSDLRHPPKTTHLVACGWSLTLIPVHKESFLYPPFLQSDQHRITHQIEFEREDHSSFSQDQMACFLENVGLFFSFCHGGWIALGLVVGAVADGSVANEEWGIGRIGEPAEPDSFLDPHHSEALGEFYPLFINRLADEDWADAIGNIVYWLRRSEIDNAGPDGGIILLQAALERLAWHLLVRHRGALSEKGFNDLTAADRLRLMLSTLAIPREVPDGLLELKSFALSYSLDAPESFTRVRNRIVHPPKLSSRKEHFPYYDAYRWGRWCAELAVLASCSYSGMYSNRTRQHRWVGQVDKVPWVLS